MVEPIKAMLVWLSLPTGDSATQALLEQRRALTVQGLATFLETTNASTIATVAAAGAELHSSAATDRSPSPATSALFAAGSYARDDSHQQCTTAGDLCGASDPTAAACCGNATCQQAAWCGGAAPPPDRPTVCVLAPSPPVPGCHSLGDACEATEDCCLSPVCNRVYCDTDTLQCAEYPPPPIASPGTGMSGVVRVREFAPWSHHASVWWVGGWIGWVCNSNAFLSFCEGRRQC